MRILSLPTRLHRMNPTSPDATALQALRSLRALSLLPEPVLTRLAAIAEPVDFDAGSAPVVVPGQIGDHLHVIETGEIELQDPEAELRLRLGAGDGFGAGLLAPGLQASLQAIGRVAGRLLRLPAGELARLATESPALLLALPTLSPVVPGAGPSEPPASGANLLSTPLRALLKREPITLEPTRSIREAAALMRDARASSVLLVEQDHLFGLITDRDLRNRVVAPGHGIDQPVSDIATLAPLTLQASQPAFEALLLMARHNVHHVPVMDGQRIVGMVTATDLNEQHSTSAVYLAGDIHKQTSVEGLVTTSARIRTMQRHLAAADASAYSTGHIVTSITDALTARLIQLAEAQLGPAPLDYVWVAAGSQARNEQTAKSDQDNCLVLDDAYDEAQHGVYFRAFSRFVCDGLAACGYVHCPGDMMAMNDEWRLPRRRWLQHFRRWIQEPEPKALMLTCVFFDLRAVAGRTELLEGVRAEVLAQTRGNSLFLAHMVGNALKHRPPLGLFGQISPARGGEHPGTVDLKHAGIVPIVDLARVYALAGGIAAVNTHDRLEQAAQSGEISEQGSRDLRDALEFMGRLRIAHQARQARAGQAPDNHVGLGELSNFERTQLKDAFGVVQTLQGVLSQRYHGGRF